MHARFAMVVLVGFLVVLAPAIRGTSTARAEWYEHVPGVGIVTLGEHCVSGEVTFDDFAVGVFDAMTLIPVFIGPTLRLANMLVLIKNLDELWLVGPAIRSGVIRFLRSDIGFRLLVKPKLYAALARRFLWETGRSAAAHVDDAARWTSERLTAGGEVVAIAGRFAWNKAGRTYEAATDRIDATWEWATN